jgi:hypothetical protein
VNTVTEDRNWFARNWKWAAPTGCLLLFVLVGAFVAAIFYFVFSLMKSNDAYQHALEAARHDPQVVASLGEPMKEGWFVSGNFEENGPSGSANLSIPLSGPKGGATIYVEAHKNAGLWTYNTLVVELDATHQRIDLNEPQALPPPSN